MIGAGDSVSQKQNNEEKFPRITKSSLKEHCKKNKLFLTPHLNDVLYLHYKGYTKIENLEEYTGLKCLWLECNGIVKIENLDHLSELRCLYLQQNLIKKIENLDSLLNLDTLNISTNSISKLENIGKLPKLQTLNVSHNRIYSIQDIQVLTRCESLSILDISFNQIEDPDCVTILSHMKNLRVLTLTGNPVIKKLSPYRKILIVSCENLQHLDDLPVFPDDRLCAKAWHSGGLEAEQKLRKKLRDEEHERINRSIKSLMKLRESHNKQKIGSGSDNENEYFSCSSEEESNTNNGHYNKFGSHDIVNITSEKLSIVEDVVDFKAVNDALETHDTNVIQSPHDPPTEGNALLSKPLIKEITPESDFKYENQLLTANDATYHNTHSHQIVERSLVEHNVLTNLNLHAQESSVQPVSQISNENRHEVGTTLQNTSIVKENNSFVREGLGQNETVNEASKTELYSPLFIKNFDTLPPIEGTIPEVDESQSDEIINIEKCHSDVAIDHDFRGNYISLPVGESIDLPEDLKIQPIHTMFYSKKCSENYELVNPPVNSTQNECKPLLGDCDIETFSPRPLIEEINSESFEEKLCPISQESKSSPPEPIIDEIVVRQDAIYEI